MKPIWVLLFSMLALCLGAFGTIAWRGTTSSLAGLRVACEVVATADRTGLLTKAQIGDVVDRFAKRIQREGRNADAADFADDLRSGCPKIKALGAHP